MDNEQLKNKIREALGAAGIGRDIAENVDKIIDSMTGKKDEQPVARSHRDEDNEAKLAAHQRQAAKVGKDEDEDEDEDDAPRVTKAAETRAKPVRKTKTARKKK